MPTAKANPTPPQTSRVVKVTGVSDELLALLDARVHQQRAAGRAEYIRELIRRDVQESAPEALLAEYHALTARDRRGTLPPDGQERLRQVERELDDCDAESPKARWMADRLAETAAKLDQLLAAVERLPRREERA